MVLPRSDGSSVVALWEAAPVWDPDASKALHVPTRQVTLQLDGTADAQVHVPRASAKAVEAQEDTGSVRVTSRADPTIIVLTSASRTSSTSEDAEDAENTGDAPDTEEPSVS
ncbi:hypothetical protein GTR00_14125 [Kineococcus sp. T90]|nr:hypothetical protein [Kineococcus indalonis]